jgi:hypothetical protein
VVVVEDQGDGFDWIPYLELAPERAFAPNGRGIAISRQLCFLDMTYMGKGNVVEVRFAAASPSTDTQGEAQADGVDAVARSSA